MFAFLQNLIILAVSVAAFVGAVWALIDATKYPDSAYVNAGKRSKALWLIILGVAAIIGFTSLPWPLGGGGGIMGLFGIAAVVAVIYYFVDVKPKVREHNYGSGPSGPSRGGW